MATGTTGVGVTGLWLLAVRAGWLKLEVAVDKGQCAGSLPRTNASRSSGVRYPHDAVSQGAVITGDPLIKKICISVILKSETVQPQREAVENEN